MTAPQHPDGTVELAVVRVPGRRLQGWLMVLAVIVAAVSLVISQQRIGGVVDAVRHTQVTNTNTLSDTHYLVGVVRAATSPAAKKAQTEAVQALVNQIDCNNRTDLKDVFGQALQQLIDRGVISAGSINLEANCPAATTTTTTTEPTR